MRSRLAILLVLIWSVSLLTGCSTVKQPLGALGSFIPVSANSLSVAPLSPTIIMSRPIQMTASVAYSDGSVKPSSSVVWQVASPTIASISQAGLVSCLKQGSTQLSASLSTLAASTTLNCTSPSVVSLSFLEQPGIIRSEASTPYHLLAQYDDGVTNDVTSLAAFSTNNSLATVNSDGEVLCNYAGSVELTASFGGSSVSTQFACVIRGFPQRPGFVESAASFEGPFRSWRNVRTAFGAVGDGIHSDSAAFQSALDSLAQSPAVLWIPRGTYLITTPLHLAGTANVTILGEDPLNTSLVWKGKTGGTMLTFTGCMGLNVGRLTLDGSGQVSELVELTWDDVSNYYPTRNLFHDSRLINAQTGLHTGWAGETTLDRLHFDHNTVAGVSLGDWNALNFNIIDSLFTDNALGVTNAYGAGAFNITNSVFERSTTADISIGNTGPFAFRNNLSVDSAHFLETAMTGAAAAFTIQGNVIYNPGSDPIVIGSPGSLTLVDNAFLHLGKEMHVLDGAGAAPLSFIAVGNAYSIAAPYGGFLGQYTSVDEAATTDVSTLPWAVPAEIYVPQLRASEVYDLSPTTTESELQGAISDASITGGVVHLPAGTYHLTKSLTVPVNGNLTLVGDGALTQLAADAGLEGPVMAVNRGQVQLKDLQLLSNDTTYPGPLLELSVPDQPSTRVECDECATLATSRNGVEIDGLDQAIVEIKVATMGADNNGSAESIQGGVLHQQGTPSLGRINNFMSSMSAFSVDHGAGFLVEDGWHDTGQGQTQMSVGDRASVTEQGGTIYVPSGTAPLGSVLGSSKTLNLLGVELNSFVSVQGSGNPDILMAGAVQFSAAPLLEGLAQDQSASLSNNWSAPSNISPVALPSSVSSPVELEQHFGTTRSQSLVPAAPPLSGTTAITLTRILTTGYGLHVTRSTFVTATHLAISPAANPATTAAYGSTCVTADTGLTGIWQLQDGLDGSFTFASGSQVLSEDTITAAGGLGISLHASAVSARDRWIVVPQGDGSFKLVNRATGDAVTRLASGCVYAAANNDSAAQHWMLTSTP